MRWDLVIFDCDGVLIDSELLSVRAGQECLAACGIELTEAELLERYTGISFAGMMADIEARHGPLPADSTIAIADGCGRCSSASSRPSPASSRCSIR